MIDTPEKIEARKNQEDPIVMYLIHNESITMGIGKFSAQCSHAAQMLQLKYNAEFHDREMARLCNWDWDSSIDESYMSLFEEWLNTSFRKVVLSADEKEWKKLKELPNHVLVIDSGLTEIPAGSETFIGLWPMRKSQRPNFIKRLQAVK